MKDRNFKMVYLGSPVHHSKLVSVYKKCCESILMDSSIRVFDVDLEAFHKKTTALKSETDVDICITLPHKVAAFNICDELTERAKMAGSVNIIKNIEGKFVGDNTDGVGFVESNKVLNNVSFNGNRILLIGAGGCARGLVPQIFKEKPSIFHVVGRPSEKFFVLKKDFDKCFDDTFLFDELPHTTYDIVINATSSSVNKTTLPLPSRVVNQDTVCLECAYSWDGHTPFTEWCHRHGIDEVYDGASMLVEQAIYAMDFFKNKDISRHKVHNLLGLNQLEVNHL